MQLHRWVYLNHFIRWKCKTTTIFTTPCLGVEGELCSTTCIAILLPHDQLNLWHILMFFFSLKRSYFPISYERLLQKDYRRWLYILGNDPPTELKNMRLRTYPFKLTINVTRYLYLYTSALHYRQYEPDLVAYNEGRWEMSRKQQFDVQTRLGIKENWGIDIGKPNQEILEPHSPSKYDYTIIVILILGSFVEALTLWTWQSYYKSLEWRR